MSNDDRRSFLKKVGALGGISAIAPLGPAAAQPTPAASDSPLPAYQFFSPPEAAFIEAAVDRFIPADELTPGGTDCGVAIFIDRQLAGAWGAGARLYRQGPWQTGTPQQGYQLPLTPAELYRRGIAAVNAHCVSQHGREFDRLPADVQVAVLKSMESAELALEEIPARMFFEIMLQNAMEGFFADPLYGGNRDKVSWKMIGYPGVIAIYSEDIKNYLNKPYDADSTSILDLV
jgi:gluconate 2-dehydrogenase gamma chain